jgi:hypothetical protein
MDDSFLAMRTVAVMQPGHWMRGGVENKKSPASGRSRTYIAVIDAERDSARDDA